MISPGEPASLKFILMGKGGRAGAPWSLCPLELLLESQPGCRDAASPRSPATLPIREDAYALAPCPAPQPWLVFHT